MFILSEIDRPRELLIEWRISVSQSDDSTQCRGFKNSFFKMIQDCKRNMYIYTFYVYFFYIFYKTYIIK